MSNPSKKILSPSNIISGIIIVLLLAVTFNGNTKALFMQGLMKVGFFRPHISMNENNSNKSYNYNSPDFRDIVFKDGDGNTFNLSSLKGKVVFINFWATWCPPCRAELPSINHLYKKFKDNNQIKFLMVDVDGKYASSSKFMEKHDWDLPVYTVEGDIPQVYLDGAIPTTIILDKEGRLVARHIGGANYDTPEIAKGLSNLIEEQ